MFFKLIFSIQNLFFVKYAQKGQGLTKSLKNFKKTLFIIFDGLATLMV